MKLEAELKKLRLQVKKEDDTRRAMSDIARKRDEETKSIQQELNDTKIELKSMEQSRQQIKT